ncbi:APC family permease [Sphingomonas sp. WKB10]|nr:APC family permease [Sphingomonas sp. WKB10]
MAGAFWAISGVPAGVLLTMGGVSTVVGQASWAVWIVSVLIGFLQCFVYAEIAGLYPDKSGGASVYGAAAWIKYSKFVAPVSVWCNWLAWSPVLALGTGLAAGYVLTSLFPADAAINTWHLTLLDLSAVKPGLTLRINAVAIIAAGFLLMTFLLQHQGAARGRHARCWRSSASARCCWSGWCRSSRAICRPTICFHCSRSCAMRRAISVSAVGTPPG